jgi:hypothetical protein
MDDIISTPATISFEVWDQLILSSLTGELSLQEAWLRFCNLIQSYGQGLPPNLATLLGELIDFYRRLALQGDMTTIDRLVLLQILSGIELGLDPEDIQMLSLLLRSTQSYGKTIITTV